MFGTDVTNISFKRNKVDLFMNGDTYGNSNMQNKQECSNLKQDAKQTPRSYQFGPFAPAHVPKVGASENSSVRDWDSLAIAHRPQYQNQGNISGCFWVVLLPLYCIVYSTIYKIFIY